MKSGQPYKIHRTRLMEKQAIAYYIRIIAGVE
jgi:hypothetical protein